MRKNVITVIICILASFTIAETKTENRPAQGSIKFSSDAVSYTHLDVYKRQESE